MSVLERWHHKVHEIPRAGIQQHREASPEIRSELAEELGIPACNFLSVAYRIQNIDNGCFDLSGRLRANLTRTCVITLEPISEDIDEPLDCSFVPPDQMPNQQVEEEEALAVEDQEPIHHDRIEVGRLIYEVLAASLDPYPRADGATLEPVGELPEHDEAAEHPFSALARLKPQDEGQA